MPNVYSLTNAMPVAMFGMFALWAPASTRHWFLRTAVVAAAILVTLLIPAYEVVIMLMAETVVVVAGMGIWRRRRRPRGGCQQSPQRRRATERCGAHDWPPSPFSASPRKRYLLYSFGPDRDDDGGQPMVNELQLRRCQPPFELIKASTTPR